MIFIYKSTAINHFLVDVVMIMIGSDFVCKMLCDIVWASMIQCVVLVLIIQYTLRFF